MPHRRRPLTELLPARVLSVAEARAAGIDPRRLAWPEMVRLSRGMYALRGADVSERDIVQAYQRSAPEAVACGNTAARLLGIPLPPGTPDWSLDDRRFRIHLSVGGSHRHDSGQLRWSELELDPTEIITVKGIRVTSRPRTLFDLAGNPRAFSLDDLVAIGDHLVRIPRPDLEQRTAPYATIGELRELAERHRGRGACRLRQALEWVVVGSDSPPETQLRLAVLRSSLPTPQVNEEIFEGALSLGQPDLSWPEWKVCVEHEGPHHRSPQQQERDIARGELRRDHGWIEVQTTARDLRSGARRAIGRIEEKLGQHGWSRHRQTLEHPAWTGG